MSEESYWHNVRRGVTGRRTQTCLLASFDRISERTGVSIESYLQYTRLRLRYLQVCGEHPGFVPDEITRDFELAKRAFRSDLGVDTPKNVVTFRVDTERDLRDNLRRLDQGGFRTCVYLNTGGLHAVGIIPQGNGYYEARSTWAPFENERSVSIDELYEWLHRPPRLGRSARQKTTRWAKALNIVALPPEPRRLRRR